MRNYENKIMMLVISLICFAGTIASFFVSVAAGLICLVMSFALTGVVLAFTMKRYKQIENLNDYLTMVCNGDYSLDINDNSEGELSILKNNLYKVVVMLQTSNEAFKNDKVYLADSLADISHQLKTPLTSMMVMADLVKQEKNEDKRTEFVEIIENQLERMKWLITTLLKLSRLDADTVELSKNMVDVSRLVDESLKPFLLTLDVKGITVSEDIEAFELLCDMNWSIEAIENIVKNCIEHTQNGGTLAVTAKATNIYSEITVSDNGCGISQEDLPHIFERFYHGKGSSSESVGIGLALSKAILEKQNAGITVESEAGKGTKFTIRFYKGII